MITQATELTKTKAAAVKESTPLIQKACEIRVTDEHSYLVADTMRSTLKAGIKKWTDRLELVIRPAREALDAIYALKREINTPMEEAVKQLDGQMKQYKLEEAARIRREQEERRQREDELRRQEEEARRKLEAAKSAPLKRILTQKVEKLEEAREAQAEVKAPAPVKVAGSTARTGYKWEVSDFKALLKAVIAGELPEDVVQVNTVQMNEYFRGDTSPTKEAMRTWPGIKVVESVTITSKGSRG